MKLSKNHKNQTIKCLVCSAIGLSFLLQLSVFAEQQQVKANLSAKEAEEVGLKVWKNECGGRVDGLTSWNAGEEFPSLGIGHFIWYPQGTTGPFVESFPAILALLKSRGVKLPEWLKPEMGCPWKSREEFLADQQSPRMIELRTMLSKTVALQTEFLIQRMQEALPKILEKAPEESRSKIKRQFERVLESGSAGAFALIDYVNFKGEGIAETERYNGKGWGMLQVLELMDEKGDPVQAYSNAAKEALARRVRNSPPARHEEKWLPGWTKRVNAYVVVSK